MCAYVFLRVMGTLSGKETLPVSDLRSAGPRSASGSRSNDPGFDTRSSHILSFLLPLIQERQLSVTGESICTKYWLTLRRSKPA